MADNKFNYLNSGADLGGECRGCTPLPEMTCGFLIQLVFHTKKWFISVEVVVHPLLKKILDPPLELALERKYR